jgi:uncharacterized membrane protein YqjE
MQAFRRLLETLVAILESRLELASIELREEKARAIDMLLLGAVAVFCGAMAVVLLTVLVVLLCWPHAAWALGGFAVIYAGMALLGWRSLRRKLKKPFFAETIAQLQKDREWLIPRN